MNKFTESEKDVYYDSQYIVVCARRSDWGDIWFVDCAKLLTASTHWGGSVDYVRCHGVGNGARTAASRELG